MPTVVEKEFSLDIAEPSFTEAFRENVIDAIREAAKDLGEESAVLPVVIKCVRRAALTFGERGEPIELPYAQCVIRVYDIDETIGFTPTLRMGQQHFEIRLRVPARFALNANESRWERLKRLLKEAVGVLTGGLVSLTEATELAEEFKQFEDELGSWLLPPRKGVEEYKIEIEENTRENKKTIEATLTTNF